MMSPCDRRRAGFTLVELMIVLVILGFAAALAMPLLDKRAPMAALGAATQEVREALAAARSAAIAGDRRVAFGGDQGGYSVDGARHSFAFAGNIAVEIREHARIAFFPSGGSTGGSVVLRGGGVEREIEINPITGRAAIVH
jgi:general secretion pathway protein H